ncbi:hypothetical protein QZM46_31050 [Burkholderia vietnamiensis]|jgi:hypothetical protein|uniref:hypothetical protein n=1 Tax=Burkholderia cepacia complex TaxID=87882 RepID=UPI0011B27F6C|nr:MULTISPECIES: hypothetical protein [Burkholderia cepacia complex]MBU9123067.1 hypothetical protein [Burkholderia multivorans]MBU9307164.1 hypothetical protein [Burkholderia multivorans]MBU9439156.1 hypothetical protein [Burkholderia multivorans]MBU9510769.1 hypothetical protein [Burkholderia multivorans]MCB4344384.1 hypothetical protein [Burkholderia vietnamiensis]
MQIPLGTSGLFFNTTTEFYNQLPSACVRIIGSGCFFARHNWPEFAYCGRLSIADKGATAGGNSDLASAK